jgi:4-amino-4-deoxy-L-arabinose transferase-like glycosyltransferase
MLSPLSTPLSAWPADRVPSPATAAISGRWCLPLIIGVALVVRLAALWASAGMGLQIVDEQHYHQLATSLARGDGFAWGPSQPTSLRPPLYPALIAGIWRVTGSDSLQAVRGVQVVLALTSIWLVYLLGARLFDRVTAATAALAFALYPSLIFSGVLLLTEVLFVTLLLAALYLTVVLLERPSWWVALASGVAFGLGALTRSVLWPFSIVLVIFLALALRLPIRARAKYCVLLLAGFALVVAPWSIRNTKLQDTFTVVDTMGGLNLLMGNYEHTPEDRMWDAVSLTGAQSWAAPLSLAPRPEGGWTEGTKEHWAQRRAGQFMLAHPLVTARRSLLKFADFWGLEREWIAGVGRGYYQPAAWFAVLSGAAITIAYPAILLAAIAGLFLAPPAFRRAHWLFVVLILFVAAIHSVTFGHARYHLPLIPILILYAAAALRHGAALLRTLSVQAIVAPGIVMGMAALIWGREVFVRDADHIAALIRVLRGGA